MSCSCLIECFVYWKSLCLYLSFSFFLYCANRTQSSEVLQLPVSCRRHDQSQKLDSVTPPPPTQLLFVQHSGTWKAKTSWLELTLQRLSVNSRQQLLYQNNPLYCCCFNTESTVITACQSEQQFGKMHLDKYDIERQTEQSRLTLWNSPAVPWMCDRLKSFLHYIPHRSIMDDGSAPFHTGSKTPHSYTTRLKWCPMNIICHIQSTEALQYERESRVGLKNREVGGLEN